VLWIWIAAIVVFVVVEAITVQLVTIWFAVGAIGGLVSCLLHAPFWLQIVVFVAVSAVTLIITKPFVKRFVNTKKQPTNADRYIGKSAVVTEPIDNIQNKGAVTVGGLEWTARSVDGSMKGKDEIVTIEAIEGAKLIVK